MYKHTTNYNLEESHMESEHPYADVTSVITAPPELAGDEMVWVVLNHLELSRRTASLLMELRVCECTGMLDGHDKRHLNR
jgi:hypothetical protein